MVRGSVGVYSACERLNVRCLVVTRHHPVSNYLVKHSTEVDDVVEKNMSSMRWETFYDGNVPALEAFIKAQLEHKDVLMFSTNSTLDVYDKPTSPACKAYIRSVVTFEPTFVRRWRSRASLHKVKEDDYGVKHVRLHDESDGSAHNCSLCCADEGSSGGGGGPMCACAVGRALLYLCLYNGENDVLLTNSVSFKRFVQRHLPAGPATFDTKPVHVGLEESHWSCMEDTMYELYLMCNARSVHTYNSYDWISNFAAIAHHVYGVPLTDMKSAPVSVDAIRAALHDDNSHVYRCIDRLTCASRVREHVQHALHAFDWKHYLRHHPTARNDVTLLLEDAALEQENDAADLCAANTFRNVSLLHYLYKCMFTDHAPLGSPYSHCARLVTTYSAADRSKQMLRHHFDPAFYMACYGSQLAKAGATTHADARKHYFKYGRPQGFFRNANEMLDYVRVTARDQA